MPVRDTSKVAFHATKEKRATMAERVMDLMSDGNTRTRHEIAKALKIATASMAGCVNGLIKSGKLTEEPGRYVCTVTGNRVRGVALP